MNWIKNNPFVATLAGITLIICAALFFLASSAGSKYQSAKEEFDSATGSVSTSEGLGLYPTPENRDGKRKALAEYGQAISDLRDLYDPYRPGDLQNVSPQDFTANLKAATEEVTKALKSSGSAIPDGFLMGFEKYANEFATEKSTGVMQYQLEGMKHALLGLAAARPSKLLGVFREVLPEENSTEPAITPEQVVRPFGYEIAFQGSEASIRAFLTSLGETKSHYFTVRTLKLENERDTPPSVSDAKFEAVRNSEPAASTADNPFGGAFVLPGSEPPPTPTEDAPAEEPAPEEPAPTVEVDSSRILAQVLGSEEIVAFVRFDLMMFLPEKELPTP